MNEHPYQRQSWLGAIALVVCIIIWLSLLMPTIQDGHRTSDSLTCRNRIKQLVMAAVEFESTEQRYPFYQSPFAVEAGRARKYGTWVVDLLPYIEQQLLRDLWDDRDENESWVAATVQLDDEQLMKFYPALAALQCPVDRTPKQRFGPMSYAANAGLGLLQIDAVFGLPEYQGATTDSMRSSIAQRPANGVFMNGLGAITWDPATGATVEVFGSVAQQTTRSKIVDGTSNTILIAENANSLSWYTYSIANDYARYKVGVVWCYAGKRSSDGRPKPAEVTPSMTPNDRSVSGTSLKRSRPSSFHLRVFNVGMADGGVRSIDDKIDYSVYQSLMAPDDANSDMPVRELAPELRAAVRGD